MATEASKQPRRHSLWKNCFVSETIIPFVSEKIKNFQKSETGLLTKFK